MSALKDLFRLAMSDYWHERLLSACSILGLTAVLTPLLVLLGVRHGLLAAMTEKLLRDPRTLEITPVGSGKYAPEWFTELASLPETAFVVPQTRSIAATMTLRKYDGNASLRPVITPLIATGADDPLLLHRNLPRASWIREESSDSSIKMPPEMTDANTRLAAGVIVSESVMRKLGGAVDDLLEGRVDRVRSGKRESAGLPLRVLAVLPPEAQPSDMLYVPLELLTASEDYRDGKGVPFLGWSGDPPPDNGPCRHTDRNPAHPNEVAKPFMASRLALGRGPNPSQASAPERNPALQGGVGAISGMKAGASDHKGSSDESTLSPSPLALYADLIRNCREYASFRLYAKSLKDIPSLWRFFQNRNVEVYIKVAEIEAVQTLDRSFSIVFGLIAGAALFGFMASTASSTLAGVRRKSRSLGIMRLLGFPRAAILLFPMSQAAVTGLLGSFLAGLLYLIVALSIDRLFSASLPSGQQAICVLPTLHMAAVFALVPLLSALSSLFAARQAITIEPSEVIRDV